MSAIVNETTQRKNKEIMRASETIDKSIKLNPAEDYNFLRREGIRHIEKLGGDVWTDFNTHDPGITLLEALCYAITDLAYRTGFDMKDLLAQNTQDSHAWKNIFYTAREILPCNPLTINDYRKLVMDVDGIRSAWITTSKDCEVPMYINYTDIQNKFNEINNAQTKDQQISGPCGCYSKIKLPSDDVSPGIKGLVFSDKFLGSPDDYKIIELNGLYKIIVEYEEEVIEKKKEDEVRKQVLKVLHRRRNVCEDYLSVTGAEYKDFFLQTSVSLSENADADLVLAEMCYLIQNYFTPVLKFYSLDEMLSLGIPADEIFEGPALKHGFIRDEELEKTDMFRDMRLSDIINFISDIDGINSLRKFKIEEDPEDPDEKGETYDSCSNEEYFDEWIEKIKNQKLVGRLSIDDMLKFFHPSEDELITPVSDIHFYKPSGEVSINTDRFLKLLNDLKGRDKYMKMDGFTNNFPVPVGENMELDNFYPVQYELPFTYRVGEPGLPLRDGKIRLIQSLQLKGYLAVFEQLFLDYMYSLSNMNEFFSFNDIKFKGKTNHKPEISACDENKETPEQKNEIQGRFPNQIIYKDEEDNIREKIAGYKCLYYDAEKYLNELQGIIEPESEFEWHRNLILDHLLSRFNEEMNEYVSLMKYLYPGDYLIRIIKNKTDLLSDYPAISNNRARAYNYKLEEEGVDYENALWDEAKIAMNISGLEKRIARLIGLPDYKRKDLAPDNLFIEEVTDKQGVKTEFIKITLYEDETKENYLLKTDPVSVDCTDETMHCFIESGCCVNNFVKYPEQRSPHHRHHHHQHHEEFSFVLRDKDRKDLASSPVYRTAKLRDDAMKLAECFLERICQGEGFHMIEHILLRPKGDTQFTDEHGNVGEEFKLLNICLDRCDLSIKKDAADKLNYKFDLQVLPPEKCRDGKRWNVILNRIVPIKDEKIPVKILEHQFKDYELASDFISKVRENGSELINFVIYRTKSKLAPDSKYYFKLKDENGKTLVESSCFTGFSNNAGDAEKAIPGKRTDCVTTIDGPIVDEIKELKKFLAYELDLYCCEEPCDHDEDPYSFRLTFVLPCWPKRFRNKGFRNFVEKTIHSETPAHIQATIFWLGIEEMRNYEEPYFNWVIEMACNDVPDIVICNDLIKQVNTLKNCDEHCREEEDTGNEGKMAEEKKTAATETGPQIPSSEEVKNEKPGEEKDKTKPVSKGKAAKGKGKNK